MPARRSISACLLILLVIVLSRPAPASEAAVPPRLQASLIARVAPFDRSLVARARTRVLLLVVIRRDDAESQHVASGVIDALKSEAQIAGLPVEVERVEVRTVREVLDEIRVRHPTIVYFSTAFSDDAPALAKGLAGEDLLTITAESEAVSRGICVGFDVVSGKPRVLINLQQSKNQHANFQATLLHLAKVVDQ